MDKSFGKFLKEKRQENNLTQKELAKILYVSDSAVSKWEKNIAHPDITLLPKLSEILGVTEHELITASIDKQSREEKVQAKKWRIFSKSWDLFFYISYIVALIPCFICNLAINKTLSWFWIVFFSLLLSFTFTNLPKLIKKHKLLLLPLSMYIALCILLATCAIYSNGNWFFVTSLSVLMGLIIIFIPIYISNYKIFSKIKKYNDFISIGIDFVYLNFLLVVIDLYTVLNNYTLNHWYFTIALPITILVYIVLNLLLSIRFLKINNFLKTSIILFLIDVFAYLPPLFINVKNPYIQREIDDCNIFKANFSIWKPEVSLDNNINCIIALTIISFSIMFLICGLISFFKGKKQNKV
ncbi:MAG: helix-turn-helix transcriptional regulator [Clostridia bacterium]|nr:helix-turn-helix transcriptional regulator [Clostridia bacterium]